MKTRDITAYSSLVQIYRWFRIARYIFGVVVVYLVFLGGYSWGGECKKSPFAIRGALPWHNFVSGPAAWNEEDYEQYLDRLEELGINFITFHCSTGGGGKKKFALYVEPMIRIEYRNVVPQAGFETSLTARWGFRPLTVRDFAFGTSKLFPLPKGAEAFGARCAVLAQTNEQRYERAQALMRRVLEMAHSRGIQVAMGFEFGMQPPEFESIVPAGSRIRGAKLPDPTHPSSIEILRAKIDDILRAYPCIDWIWLWLHEHPTLVDKAQMSGRFRKLYERDASLFKEADSEVATFVGVWSLAYIRLAHAYIVKRAPKVRVAIAGWGGSSKLPTILRGLDRGLPKTIVFTRLNPHYGFKPQPEVLAEIAKNREVWAVPWLESDSQLWHLQPRVTLMREHVKLAHKQGLSGVVALHWRTEETRLNLNAFARFARDPNGAPSVEALYREDCKRQYGAEAALELAPILTQMDREQWLRLSIISPEFGSFSPAWGRVTPETEKQFGEVIARIERLNTSSKNPQHKANLDWLSANFKFMLLLDKVSRKIEPVYNLKDKWFCGETNPNTFASEVEQARKALDEAPIEELFHTYASRVRSRGELGVLSSLNQKLWLQYKELDTFLATVQRKIDAGDSQ